MAIKFQEIHFDSYFRVHTLTPFIDESMLRDSFSTSDDKLLLVRVQDRYKIPCLCGLLRLSLTLQCVKTKTEKTLSF